MTFIDTRDWSTRKLDTDTSAIAPSGFGPGCFLCSGVLVAYGSNGLTGYESDGTVRFHMFEGKQVRPIVAASYAYVGAVGDGTHYTIVDTATGNVVTSVVTSVPTYLAPFPYY